jgi:GrpB-like predicted nucleotidyltransferase (UPF0157 family)
MPVPRVDVAIAAYDPQWSRIFEEERVRLGPLASRFDAAVHHIGSTAVPGLDAKPIIDILLTIRHFGDADAVTTSLAGLGYQHNHWADTPERRLLFRGDPMSHQIHLVALDSDACRRQLAFRDWMRTHPDEAGAYAVLKKDLAARLGHDHRAYTNAKGEFVERCVRLALGNDGFSRS